MSAQDDSRLYASECLKSAMNSTNNVVRGRFLELAKLWMAAAQHDDGMPVPIASKDAHNNKQHWAQPARRKNLNL
jgi:hypothetical protein